MVGVITPADAPAGCDSTPRCPAPGDAWAWRVAFAARVVAGLGVASGRVLLDGAEIAACGPMAVGCSGEVRVGLEAGETRGLRCETGPLTVAAGAKHVECLPVALH